MRDLLATVLWQASSAKPVVSDSTMGYQTTRAGPEPQVQQTEPSEIAYHRKRAHVGHQLPRVPSSSAILAKREDSGKGQHLIGFYNVVTPETEA